MFKLKITLILLIASLFIAVICGGCNRSVPPDASVTITSSAPASKAMQNSGIEVELVTLQPIDGAVLATGKILVTEDHTASIRPGA